MADEFNGDALDALFAEARRVDAAPELRVRVLADGLAVAGEAGKPANPRRRGSGGWLGWLDNMGGWPALSGVTAAGIAGLSLGLYAPEVVDLVLGGQLTTFMGGSVTPDMDTLLLAVGDFGDV